VPDGLDIFFRAPKVVSNFMGRPEASDNESLILLSGDAFSLNPNPGYLNISISPESI
jgi:hypothetical protein